MTPADRDMINRAFSEMGEIRRSVVEVHTAVGRVDERVEAAMDRFSSVLLEMQSQRAEDLQRIEKLEVASAATSKQLFWFKTSATAAGSTTLAVLMYVGWLLSKIPPAAWSAMAR